MSLCPTSGPEILLRGKAEPEACSGVMWEMDSSDPSNGKEGLVVAMKNSGIEIVENEFP